MSEDHREAQSKFAKPAPTGSLLRPATEPEPDVALPEAARTPAVPPPPPPVVPMAPAVPPPPTAPPPPASAPPTVGAGALAPNAAARWAAIAGTAPGLAAAPRPVPAVPAADLAPAPRAVGPMGAETGPDTDDEADDELPLTFGDRLRRLSPALVTLTVGSLGSVLFLFRAVTSHTTPVPVLMSAGVVTGLIFGADAVISSIATWRAATNGDSGRALLLALVGGISYVISFGAFAGLVVMILVLNS